MKELLIKIILMVVPMLLEALRAFLTNETFIKYGDKILDVCENWIDKEPGPYDGLLHQLINIIHEMAKIPDLPDGV